MGMGLSAIRMRPGPTAVGWLFDRIAELQRDDRLAPIAVIVPNNYVGLGLRRALAQRGYANVRFTILARIAEALGARALAEAGLSPLTPIVEDALIRTAIRSAPAFGPIGQHRALVDTLRSLFRTLREREPAATDRAEWAAHGPMASAALATFAQYERLLTDRRLYDERIGIDAAAEALARSSASAIREIGTVLLYLPARLSPAATRFLVALAERAPVEVLLAWCDDAAADADSIANAAALR